MATAEDQENIFNKRRRGITFGCIGFGPLHGPLQKARALGIEITVSCMNKSFIIVSLWLLFINGVQADEIINEKNWVNHPEIVEVRSLYQTIKKLKKDGNLIKQERKFKYCKPYEDTVRDLYTDESGKPRIYNYQGGSDDSAVKRELYYDENGRLRFAFIIAGAYNGTKLEIQVYFSEAGKRVWEVQKHLEGPGYTFPKEWPKADLIKEPVQAYNNESSCPEIK